MSTPDMKSAEMILLAVSLILAAASLAATGWMYIQLRAMRNRQQELTSGVAATLRELELLAAMSARSTAHAERLERDCTALAERLDVLEMRGESRPYDRAIDSARQGADPTRLARLFGLSPTEAQLVTLLHGAKRRA